MYDPVSAVAERHVVPSKVHLIGVMVTLVTGLVLKLVRLQRGWQVVRRARDHWLGVARNVTAPLVPVGIRVALRLILHVLALVIHQRVERACTPRCFMFIIRSRVQVVAVARYHARLEWVERAEHAHDAML